MYVQIYMYSFFWNILSYVTKSDKEICDSDTRWRVPGH